LSASIDLSEGINGVMQFNLVSKNPSELSH
jgi:hypothetical protein